MRNQRTISTVIGVMLAGAFMCVQAPGLTYPVARIPRTKDGKPNLSAPAPRLNGKPDVSGVWQAERRSASEYNRIIAGFTDIQPDTHDITPNVLNVFWGMKPEEEPLRPEAAALVKYRLQHALEYPHTQCLPGGIPLALLVFTFKIIQTPHQIVMLSETADPPRQIHTDGRPFPKDPDPTWMGHSLRHWEGETLAVDPIDLNDRAR